jgi:small subunit ribosomal protein S1
MDLPISDPMTEDPSVSEGPSFGDILTEFEQQQTRPEQASALEGTVLSITDDAIFVDVGRKSDGVLDPAQFRNPDGTLSVAPGAKLKVSIRGTNEQGQLLLSAQPVEQPKDFSALQAAMDEKKTIAGRVLEVVKGGLRVDIGVRAFMPASRSGVREVAELEKLVGQEIECRITKIDVEKEDFVVDRRVVLEEREKEAKQKAFEQLSEGQVVPGTVRNMTDFGAFIDLGGIDGLLHVADISWTRVGKPSDVLKAGEAVDVKILKINRETRKISLGMKQLQPEPWTQAAEKFQPGDRVKGTVARLTDFGAFVELMPGVEGLIHVSEMSWTKRSPRPADILTAGEQVEAIVLGVNPGEKRISLGLKQALGDPWAEVPTKFAKGTIVEAPVTSIQKFGAFVQLAEGIDGMIHVGDITNEKRIETPKDVLSVGQVVRAQVTEVDAEKRRIRLSMRQLEPTKADEWIGEHQVGETVTGRVVEVRESRLEVELGEGVSGVCRISQENRQGGSKSGNAQKVDVSTATALLAARWKSGGAVAEKEANTPRPGQTRSFKIIALDPAKRRIDLELA